MPASLLALLLAALASAIGAQERPATPLPPAVLEALQAPGAVDRIAGLAALERHAASLEASAREAMARQTALLLADDQRSVRTAAMDTLLAIAPRFEAQRESLEAIIGSVQDYIVEEIFWLDGGLEPMDGLAEKALERLTHQDAGQRALGVEQLCSLGTAAQPHQVTVLALIADPAPQVRAAVAKGVAGIGWNETVRSALVQALRDAEGDVRKHAAEGLAGQEDPVVVAALRGALQDPDDNVRDHALRSLATAGPPGRIAANDIIASLRDRVTHVRLAALIAVGGQQLSSPRAIRELRRILATPDRRELDQALRTVHDLGPAASPLFDTTFGLIERTEEMIGRLAFLACWRIADASPEQRGRIVLRSIEALGRDPEDIRGYAHQVLTDWIR